MKFNRIVMSNFLIGRLRKHFFIMRLTLYLVLVLSLPTSASVWSQTMSVKLKNSTLQELFQHIEKSSNYRFFYNNDDVDVNQRISIDVEDETVGNILANVFNVVPYSFKELENKLILIEKADYKTNPSFSDSQQQKTVTGRINDPSGVLIPGATVVVKGTTMGTLTDDRGDYSISNIPGNATLKFSFVGMKSQEVQVGNKAVINVVLEYETISVDEVVVTALGIERSAKSLTYSTQKVSGDELTKVVNPNLMNSMAGKVAGVFINQSPGVGSSVKVLIRGNKSIQRNNQPLYVVDGMPMSSGGSQSRNNLASSYDNGGDGISNLNPDDIESINVLKGASAAALYGSQAGNGVILITTKKGKSGTAKIDFSSTFTIDDVLYLPDLQKSYGQTAANSNESWGPPISSSPDNISGFYNTGTTFVNSISLSAGNDKMQTYVSYANTSSKGILEDNTLSRNNIFLREFANFFDKKLSVEASANMIFQNTNNPPVAGDQQSVVASLYKSPVGIDLAPYKNYEKYDPVKNVMTQNWYTEPHALTQNPYWIMNRMLKEYERTRTMLKLSLKYNIADWINLQVRGNLDHTISTSELKNYYGTAAAYGFLNGYYSISKSESPIYYADAMLNVSHTFGAKIKLNAILGSSINDSHNSGMDVSSTVLKIPNVFILQNMQMMSGTYLSTNALAHQQLQSLFGSANLNYDDWLSLDITGRNDWSSTLSFTPNVSFFYPSFGLTGLLHEAFSLPEAISFAKLRGSYAIVGNTVPLYVTNPSLGSISGGSIINFNNTTPFTDLKPEKSKSMEFGADLKFLKNQFSIDFTYYKTNTTNQFFTVAVPPGTGYSYRYVNGGDIQNSGIELIVGYTSPLTKALKWDSSINFSTNKNVVKELAEGFDQFVINDDLLGYNSILKVGGSYGDIYGQTLKRDDQGRAIISESGSPIASGTKDFLGNPYPDFMLAWNNSFNYHDFSLSLLIDCSVGGKIMSLSEMELDKYGVSKVTGTARDNGGVEVNGITENTSTTVTRVDPQKWYTSVGTNVVGEYMYDATTVRLRELTFGYSIPTKRLNMNYIQNLKLSLIGRNLFYFYKPAPYDSSITYSTGNGYSGVDLFAPPATRNIGISLNVTF
jgi:TonB-linked SusC/RagA family outer membrane protein